MDAHESSRKRRDADPKSDDDAGDVSDEESCGGDNDCEWHEWVMVLKAVMVSR
jgi:hypothetical protein